MNIVLRSTEKYSSLSTNTIEDKFITLITENANVLKNLSNNSLSGILPGEVINQMISFTNNNQAMVQLIEEYFTNQSEKYHNLRICLAAIHRISIQLNLITCKIEMNYKLDDIPQNFLGLLLRTWACYVPIVLDYIFSAFHPDSGPLIVLYA